MTSSTNREIETLQCYYSRLENERLGNVPACHCIFIDINNDSIHDALFGVGIVLRLDNKHDKGEEYMLSSNISNIV